MDHLGILVEHKGTGCPVAPSVLCQQCHAYGHMTSQCPEDWSHWVRPTCLEDLIPSTVRTRYGIKTMTPFHFEEKRHEGTLEEQGARMVRERIQVMRIPNYLDTTLDSEGRTGYDRLGIFMKTHDIQLTTWYPQNTKVSKEDGGEREKAVKAWCVAQGYAVSIVGHEEAA